MQKDPIFELCDIVRETGFAIHKYLGPGHLEKVYVNALVNRLGKRGLHVQPRHPCQVYDEDGTILGEFFADLLIEQTLIVEAKAVAGILNDHIAQILGYLRATRLEHGLLVNFGSRTFAVKKYYCSDAIPGE
ncbi:MAG: GxxExxY protein [Pirellulales bacterium]|nr:GxxExxY protein [Pirellulales bacterium]